MKVLMFDLEHGSKTIGSKEHIQSLFTYPVLSPGNWGQFQSTLVSLYKEENVTTDVTIGNLTIPETTKTITSRNGTPVDALVVDTFSELSKKYMREISDKHGKMQLQGWGQLKNKLDGCLDYLTRIPGFVICLCHSKVQTMDDGNKIIPYIDGSTKDDISKWFDFVFYTKTIKTKNGTREYRWITQRDEKYDHAKDRSGLLSEEIAQDFNLIKVAVSKKGWDGAKILIIGAPGSGKTKSLETLITQGESNESNSNN